MDLSKYLFISFTVLFYGYNFSVGKCGAEIMPTRPCFCNPLKISLDQSIDGEASFCPSCYFFQYSFSTNQDWAARLCIKSSKATAGSPLFVVVRESLNVATFSLPITFPSAKPYFEICKTLCPLSNYPDSESLSKTQNMSVEVSSSADNPIDFTLVLEEIKNFTLVMNEPRTVNITPTAPAVFQYDMETELKSVRIEAKSYDKSCMILSIQDLKCPLHDTANVGFPQGLYYQTLTQQSGIFISHETFPKGRQYIILMLLPTDSECQDYIDPKHEILNREKEVTIEVFPSITDSEFYGAIFGALAFYIVLYLFSFVICCTLFIRKRKKDDVESSRIENPSVQNYGSTSDSETETGSSLNSLKDFSNNIEDRRSSQNIDETDMDKLPDVEVDKNVVRTKITLYVADLSKKTDVYLIQRTKVYSWNLLTISVFYGLPVIQLVYINQEIVILTGNQDLCYYNFLCSHKVGVFSDFNHIYSNIGYVLLGILFLLLVWKRSVTDTIGKKSQKVPQRELTGIPRHYGLLYSMGFALVMEGFLSASYHVCPNKANFQFDTAFMYVIATVCMLKLYHGRHPDIAAKSHITWMILAIVIIMCFAGMVKGGLTVWILFVFGHIVVTLFVSAKIYYVGRCKVGFSLLKRIHHNLQLDIASGSFKPMYLGRFVSLVIAACVNFGLDLYGLIKQPENFGFFLLLIFIINLFLYLSYYSLMKKRYGEKIGWIPFMFTILSFCCWGAALYFFQAKNTSWQVTPAESRERNKHCILLNFFDHHDIWHFLSSCGLFFSFMVMFTLDDDLIMTPRTEIVVF